MPPINLGVKPTRDTHSAATVSAHHLLTGPIRLRPKKPVAESWPGESAQSASHRVFDRRVAEHVADSRMSPAEIRRRLCHMLPGLLAFLLPNIPHSHPLSWFMLLRMTALAAVLALGVILVFRKIARPGEQHGMFNVLSYPASIILTLLLFPGHPEFATVVLVVLAFGDGSATLFGLLHGHSPLPWNARKTWVGTIAFIVCAAPLAALAYWQESRPHAPFSVALAVGIVAAIVADVAESLPLRVSDNLRVGLAAMVGVVTAHAGFIGWS